MTAETVSYEVCFARFDAFTWRNANAASVCLPLHIDARISTSKTPFNEVLG